MAVKGVNGYQGYNGFKDAKQTKSNDYEKLGKKGVDKKQTY